MSKTDILTERDILTPRSPAKFLEWMIAKNNELSATAETKRYARSGAQLPKKFSDEIYFLALFANEEFGTIPGTEVVPNLNNDNFDATVSFEDGSKVFIEITQAKDGYDESLRLEVLSREGAVSLTSPILRVEGKRGAQDRNVTIPLQYRAKDHRKTMDENLLLAESSIRAKMRRQYGKNFILVVVVDDYLAFREKPDHAPLDKLISQKLLLPELDFGRLVVLGRSGKILLSYNLATGS
jgi:hypothetical protein